MEILAHRGLWLNKEEKNSFSALTRALDEGYGLETDIRDHNGDLVIEHDMPFGEKILPFEKLLRFYTEGNYKTTLALNIKSDGLQEKLSIYLREYHIKKYFVFDMSIPDTLGYLKNEMTTFIRRSDIERHPEIQRLSQGIWLDEMLNPWIDATVIVEESKMTPALCIVSAELHGRDYTAQWNDVNAAVQQGVDSNKLLICTDRPKEAEGYFK